MQTDTAAFRTALASDLFATEARLSALHADASRAAVAAQQAYLDVAGRLSTPSHLAAQAMLLEFWRSVEAVRQALADANIRRRVFTDPPGVN